MMVSGKTRNIILLLCIVLVIGLALTVYFIGFYNKNVEAINFTKVKNLQRDALFITYDDHVLYMNPSQDIDCHYGMRIYAKFVPLYDGNISVRPDEKSFFIATFKEILEFDNSANLLRRIPIKDFEFGFDVSSLVGRSCVSNDRLWFTVNKKGKYPNQTSKRTIIEWLHDKPPNTKTIGPEIQTNNWDVDTVNRNIYIAGKNIKVFDFTTGSLTTTTYGAYDHVDYDRKRGLLLSNSPRNSNSNIITINLENNLKNEITKGSFAVWGSDDVIYFCRGTTQLWSCKTDGSDSESIIIADKDYSIVEGIGAPPCLSHDKTFLSYFYSKPRLIGQPYWGIVLLDLKRMEYMELFEGNVLSTEMAWIVK